MAFRDPPVGGGSLGVSGYADVTDERSARTTFQNTTGSVLEVVAREDSSSDSAESHFRVGPTSSDLKDVHVEDNRDETPETTARVLVKPGSYYELVNPRDLDEVTWLEQEILIE